MDMSLIVLEPGDGQGGLQGCAVHGLQQPGTLIESTESELNNVYEVDSCCGLVLLNIL